MTYIEKIKSIQMDVWITLSVLVLATFLTFTTDYVHEWHEFAEHHPEYHIESLFHLLAPASLCVLVIAIRRNWQLRHALRDLKQARRDLLQKQQEEIKREKFVSLGQLSSGLAHEINNALQPVLGLSDVIHKHVDPKYMDGLLVDCAVLIQDNARQMRNILRQVLLFSRGEVDEIEKFNIKQVMSESIDFTSKFMPSSLAVKTEYISDTMPIDEMQIKINKTALIQVMTNLINNAAQAMKNTGEIKINIHGTEIDHAAAEKMDIASGEYLEIAIIDQGTGMDAKTLAHAFEPFFTTKGEGEGTGLGLSIVYGIVRGWGGNIHLESTVGIGTTAKLYIPIAI